jgi:hypothetical protein
MHTPDDACYTRLTAPTPGSDDSNTRSAGTSNLMSNDQPFEEDVPALIATRKAKRDALRAAGVNPYAYSFSKTHSVEELTKERFAELAQASTEVAVSGRYANTVGWCS